MQFADLRALMLLLAVPVLAALVWAGWLATRRRLHMLVSKDLARRMTIGSSKWRRAGGAALQLGAIGLGVIALARPQWGRRDEPVVRRGVDVVFALDVSASMLAEDVSPSRIEQARAAAVTLLDSLKGDRVGLVVFGGRAVAVCPLTVDYGAVRLFLDAADPDLSPGPGSDVGRAIEEAERLFKSSERRYKAIVLFTDGEDLEGKGEETARKAHDEGVVIHAVGVGTLGGGPIPLRDDAGTLTAYKKDKQGRVVTTRFDSSTLERITLTSDGLFLHAGPVGEEGRRIAEAIAGMEKKEIASRIATRYEDRFQIPLVAALALLCVDALWLGRRASSARARMFRGAAPAASAAVATLAIVVLSLGGPGAVLAEGQGSPAPPAPAGTQSSSTPAPPAGPSAVAAQEPRAPAAAARSNRDGNRLYDQKRYKDALGKYEEASAGAPESPAIRYNIGNALYRQGKFDAAASEYERALAQAGGRLSAATRYNLGNTLYQQGRFQEAADAYGQTLAVDPNDEDARRNLELALRMLKKPPQSSKSDSKDSKQNKSSDQKSKQDQDSKKDQQQKQDQQQQQQNQDQKQDQQKQEEQQSQAQNRDKNASQPQKSQGAEAQKDKGIDRKDAERLLDSLAQEEKRDLKKRLARLPHEEGPEKDW